MSLQVISKLLFTSHATIAYIYFYKDLKLKKTQYFDVFYSGSPFIQIPLVGNFGVFNVFFKGKHISTS